MIDLHCHSTASDGVYTPTQLAEMADAAHLSALALTDHDSLDGLDEFMAAAASRSFRPVPGIEFSCYLPGGSRCHILGLFLKKERCACIYEGLEKIRQWRHERNLKILDKLASLGKPVPMDLIEEILPPGGTLGRPHIADAMIKLKYCDSHETAFNKYLESGGLAYVRRQTLNATESIQLLHKAGAVAIWAHPMASKCSTPTQFRRRIKFMVEQGLDGFEAYYPLHDQHRIQIAIDAARNYGLLVSGGTDFHGGNRHPGINMGTGKGEGFCVQDSLLEPLFERAARY